MTHPITQFLIKHRLPLNLRLIRDCWAILSLAEPHQIKSQLEASKKLTHVITQFGIHPVYLEKQIELLEMLGQDSLNTPFSFYSEAMRIIPTQKEEKLFQQLLNILQREKKNVYWLNNFIEEKMLNNWQLGQFFTPQPVAEFIQRCIPPSLHSATIVDIACGTGNLLLPHTGKLHGFDIDQFMALTAHASLLHKKAVIRHQNGLHTSIEPDIAILNPPFSHENSLPLIEKAINITKNNGLVFMILDKNLSEYVAQNHASYLTYSIKLPTPSFLYTSIATRLIILKKNRDKKTTRHITLTHKDMGFHIKRKRVVQSPHQTKELEKSIQEKLR